MDMYYLEELLAYVLGTVLSVTFFALLIITGAMFARQNPTSILLTVLSFTLADTQRN